LNYFVFRILCRLHRKRGDNTIPVVHYKNTKEVYDKCCVKKWKKMSEKPNRENIRRCPTEIGAVNHFMFLVETFLQNYGCMSVSSLSKCAALTANTLFAEFQTTRFRTFYWLWGPLHHLRTGITWHGEITNAHKIYWFLFLDAEVGNFLPTKSQNSTLT